MVLLERRGKAEVGGRRRTMRSGRVVALFQQLHNLASCPLLRFSSAMRSTLLRVHHIRPHQQTLHPVPPLHRMPTIRLPRAAAPANGAEEEEEADTEEEHSLRTPVREGSTLYRQWW
jgi:hypothetical protein